MGWPWKNYEGDLQQKFRDKGHKGIVVTHRLSANGTWLCIWLCIWLSANGTNGNEAGQEADEFFAHRWLRALSGWRSMIARIVKTRNIGVARISQNFGIPT